MTFIKLVCVNAIPVLFHSDRLITLPVNERRKSGSAMNLPPTALLLNTDTDNPVSLTRMSLEVSL